MVVIITFVVYLCIASASAAWWYYIDWKYGLFDGASYFVLLAIASIWPLSWIPVGAWLIVGRIIQRKEACGNAV